jgi:hypothetical protein
MRDRIISLNGSVSEDAAASSSAGGDNVREIDDGAHSAQSGSSVGFDRDVENIIEDIAGSTPAKSF